MTIIIIWLISAGLILIGFLIHQSPRYLRGKRESECTHAFKEQIISNTHTDDEFTVTKHVLVCDNCGKVIKI